VDAPLRRGGRAYPPRRSFRYRSFFAKGANNREWKWDLGRYRNVNHHYLSYLNYLNRLNRLTYYLSPPYHPYHNHVRTP